MHSRNQVVERIADDIREWLRRNPDAADTLEGIRDFWLSEESGLQPEELIAEALERLRKEGVVHEELQRPGIPGIYRSANRAQRRDGE